MYSPGSGKNDKLILILNKSKVTVVISRTTTTTIVCN